MNRLSSHRWCKHLSPCGSLHRSIYWIHEVHTVLRQRLTHFHSAQNLKNASIFGVSIFGLPIFDCIFPKFINVKFWIKKYRKVQSKSGTPKIDTPKIDAFFKFWPLWKCVNLWRRTVQIEVYLRLSFLVSILEVNKFYSVKTTINLIFHLVFKIRIAMMILWDHHLWP